MTTLIFVSPIDASPLIELEADEADVLRALARCRGLRAARSVGETAARFLAYLSPDEWDVWQPAIESTPIDGEEAAWDAAETDITDMIVWNVLRWEETTPATTPPTVGFEENPDAV